MVSTPGKVSLRPVGGGTTPGSGLEFDPMAEPAQRRRPRAEAPPLDPSAVDRAYRFYRARRHAKIEHRRATRMARWRFWAFLGLLVLACLVLAVTVWNEITKLFGL
jgi:hypothetical protein